MLIVDQPNDGQKLTCVRPSGRIRSRSGRTAYLEPGAHDLVGVNSSEGATELRRNPSCHWGFLHDGSDPEDPGGKGLLSKESTYQRRKHQRTGEDIVGQASFVRSRAGGGKNISLNKKEAFFKILHRSRKESQPLQETHRQIRALHSTPLLFAGGCCSSLF